MSSILCFKSLSHTKREISTILFVETKGNNGSFLLLFLFPLYCLMCYFDKPFTHCAEAELKQGQEETLVLK